MPTYEYSTRFWNAYKRLHPDEQAAFLKAPNAFVAALKAGQRPQFIQNKRFKLLEFPFGPNLRTLFRYGEEKQPGEAHIVWESIGTHDIYKR